MSSTTSETKDIPFEPGESVRGKWLMDGATTLEEAAKRLEGFAKLLRQAHDAGWTLDRPIEDDYGHIVDPEGNRGWLDEADADWDEDEEDWEEE